MHFADLDAMGAMQAIELIKQHNLAFGPNKASNSGSFALATKNLGTTELTPEELDAVVKGASLLPSRFDCGLSALQWLTNALHFERQST